jgi:hypothetical protein
MTERPKQSDPAIREKAIAALAEDCAKWADDKPEDWIEPLSRLHFYRNGYELASDLERYAHVSPDLELVEIMEGASGYVWEAHREAVKAWIDENNIRPTLEVGARVRFSRGEGFINGIREDEGIYCVLQEHERGLPQYQHGGGLCVAYEDAELIAEAA